MATPRIVRGQTRLRLVDRRRIWSWRGRGVVVALKALCLRALIEDKI